MFDYIEKLAQGTKASMYLRLRSHFVKPTKSLKGAGGLERPVEGKCTRYARYSRQKS